MSFIDALATLAGGTAEGISKTRGTKRRKKELDRRSSERGRSATQRDRQLDLTASEAKAIQEHRANLLDAQERSLEVSRARLLNEQAVAKEGRDARAREEAFLDQRVLPEGEMLRTNFLDKDIELPATQRSLRDFGQLLREEEDRGHQINILNRDANTNQPTISKKDLMKVLGFGAVNITEFANDPERFKNMVDNRLTAALELGILNEQDVFSAQSILFGDISLDDDEEEIEEGSLFNRSSLFDR